MPKALLAASAAGAAILAVAAPSSAADRPSADRPQLAPASELGNGPSTAPDVSSGGRYVAFSSAATDLVTGDTNGRADVFLRDTAFRKTKLVSVGLNGAKANGNSYEPQVSDDGRYVVFMSDATNLVPGDTNRKTDIFRTDLSTGRTTRISTSQSGAQANGVSKRPRINSTASVIAFVSTAPNLVAGDTNRIQDIFVRNLGNNTVKRISMTPRGGQLSVMAYSPSVSYDGKIVGFVTDAYADPAVQAHCGRTTDTLAVLMKWTVATSKASVTEAVCRSGAVRELVLEPRANMRGGVGYAIASDYGYTSFHARGEGGLSDWLEYGNSYSKAYWDTGRWGGAMAYTNSAATTTYIFDLYGPQASRYYPAAAVSMSPDGAYVALQGRSDGQIYLWNWPTDAWELISTR